MTGEELRDKGHPLDATACTARLVPNDGAELREKQIYILNIERELTRYRRKGE